VPKRVVHYLKGVDLHHGVALEHYWTGVAAFGITRSLMCRTSGSGLTDASQVLTDATGYPDIDQTPTDSAKSVNLENIIPVR
jgi:hypothetical protein